ncbi:MAG: hypothetical protein V7K35_05600 [Nostoc sp.]
MTLFPPLLPLLPICINILETVRSPICLIKRQILNTLHSFLLETKGDRSNHWYSQNLRLPLCPEPPLKRCIAGASL